MPSISATVAKHEVDATVESSLPSYLMLRNFALLLNLIMPLPKSGREK